MAASIHSSNVRERKYSNNYIINVQHNNNPTTINNQQQQQAETTCYLEVRNDC